MKGRRRPVCVSGQRGQQRVRGPGWGDVPGCSQEELTVTETRNQGLQGLPALPSPHPTPTSESFIWQAYLMSEVTYLLVPERDPSCRGKQRWPLSSPLSLVLPHPASSDDSTPQDREGDGRGIKFLSFALLPVT